MAREFASLARHARLQSRVTLREVAEALRVSIAFVSEVERGNRTAPTPERAELWARAVHGDPRAFRRAALCDRASADFADESVPVFSRDAALALARAMDDLTPEQARQIIEIVGSGNG
jgi:transcriptional regulator with XRE-family HTH domain